MSIELTELSAEQLAEAAAGERKILAHNGTPQGALVSLSDLEKLNSWPTQAKAIADRSPVKELESLRAAGGVPPTYSELLYATAPLHASLGATFDGNAIALPVNQHYLFAGDDEAELRDLQRTAVLGAALSTPATDLQFVFATSRAVHSFTEDYQGVLPHVVNEACDLQLEDASVRLIAQLRGEMEARSDLLRQYRVGSIQRLREQHSELADKVPDLVIAVEHPHELDNSTLLGTFESIGRRADYGIYVWMFIRGNEPPTLRHELREWLPIRLATWIASPRVGTELVGLPPGYTGTGAHELASGEAIIARSQTDRVHFQLCVPEFPDGRVPSWSSAHVERWPELPDQISWTKDVLPRWTGVQRPSATAPIIPLGLADNPRGHRLDVLEFDLRAAPGIVASKNVAERSQILSTAIHAASVLYPDLNIYTSIPAVGGGDNVNVGSPDEVAEKVSDYLGRLGDEEPQGLPALFVIDQAHAISLDFWLSTAAKLARMDPRRGLFAIFGTSDSPPGWAMHYRGINWIEAGRHIDPNSARIARFPEADA